MGIVNITPDSFFDGGSYRTEAEILGRCETVIDQGADIIDIGAVSTRPGAQAVSLEEERRRLESALGPIRKRFPDALVSADTYRAEIVRSVAADYGADIINDISGGDFDPDMFAAVAALNIPYVLTHIKGTPDTMQKNPVYDDVMTDIIRFFSERVQRLRACGVKDIIIDPGFGFGKTVEHNYEILRRLKDLDIFEMPVLAGVSRKSMICKLLEVDAKHALNGTTAVNMLALINGADILRVHDVKEAAECIKIAKAYQHSGNSVGVLSV